MAADIKTKYPSNSSVALTISLASLASDTNLLAGRASTVVDNYTTTNDIDHILSGYITTGTSPTVSTTIELWIYGTRTIISGTPAYPDGITGSDANKTLTSTNVKNSGLIRLNPIIVDNTTARAYDIAPISIASLFGGSMPPYWGLFVVQNTGVALNSTSGNHVLHYYRIQNQSV